MYELLTQPPFTTFSCHRLHATNIVFPRLLRADHGYIAVHTGFYAGCLKGGYILDFMRGKIKNEAELSREAI